MSFMAWVLTEAAEEGMAKCQPGLHCCSPAVMGRVTTPMTGEQIWEVISGLSGADIVP